MSSRDEVPCWSIRPTMNKMLMWMAPGSSEGTSAIESWVPIELLFCSSEGISAIESWVPIELLFLFKRGYIGHRVVSPYWTITGTKKRKTLLIYLRFAMEFTYVILLCVVIYWVFFNEVIYVLLRAGIWFICAIKLY